MATALIVTWSGGGNAVTALALGRLLADDGVDVRVLGAASLADRCAAEGLALSPRDPGDEWDLGAQARDAVAACRHDGPDIAIVDFMMPAALGGAEVAGVPTVALVHTLYGALATHADAPAMATSGTLDAVNATRRDVGLDPVAGFGHLLRRVRLVLVSAPPELDVVPDPLDANVAYAGAVLEGPGADAGWSPPSGEGPLVVVSLGTTDMDELPVLRRILAALDGEPVRVLATVGDHVDLATIASPANAVVTGYVRHAAVLPHASLVITHAGLGTVVAALANGCPMLCLPLGRDQPVNAAAVERLGAGTTLSPDAGTGAIRRAVTDLLAPGGHRDAAVDLATVVRPPPGGHPAVRLIGDLLP